jgi:hypothetical protein
MRAQSNASIRSSWLPLKELEGVFRPLVGNEELDGIWDEFKTDAKIIEDSVSAEDVDMTSIEDMGGDGGSEGSMASRFIAFLPCAYEWGCTPNIHPLASRSRTSINSA